MTLFQVVDLNCQFLNLVKLLLLCTVFLLCWGEKYEAGDLKKIYSIREDLPKGSPLFCAKLSGQKIKELKITSNKPLKTIAEVKNGNFCVILDDFLSFKEADEYTLVLDIVGINDEKLGKRYVTVKLEQVNRHPPRFEPYNDSLELEEEVVGGHGKLLNLNATDEDYRDSVMYSIHNIESLNNKFSMTSNTSVAILWNREKLDYETKTYYRIEAIAVDNVNGRMRHGGQHTSTAVIHVNVIDIDDQPPVFQKECGMTKIKEHEVGHLTNVHAIDGDRGLNRPIRYILGDVSSKEFFSVTRRNDGDAIVAVTNEIDREDPRFISNPLITFSIQVNEYLYNNLIEINPERNATSICTVMIEDVNDNSPTFSEQTYLAKVKENTQLGIPVTFINNELPTVTDIDEGENAMFELYLENNDKTFAVTPTDGINNVTFLLRVNNVEALDYERPDLPEPKQFQLQIVAKEKFQDQPNISTAIIIVELEDENDNFPQFISPEKVNISENASAGDVVIQIQAFDIDSEFFGTKGIRYSLLPSHISKNFSIDQITGVLNVSTNEHGFDRETTEIHYLTVEARDNNGTGNRNTTQLQIELLDANDNAPVFLFSSYKSQLLENSVHFTDKLNLEAKDRDKEDTPNSEVRYVISDGDQWKQFQIDEKEGTLTPREKIDFEDEAKTPALNKPCVSVCTRTYELIVTAHDLGEPRQSNNVSVYITLQDENDNIPIFNESRITATINETSPQGTAIACVKAFDDDISPIYKNVSYSIIRGGEGNFVIDRNSGCITVGRNADLDVSYNATKKQRLLSIEASDPMMKSSVCEVQVTIIDINDKNPEFRNIDTVEYEVMENLKDKTIGIFLADDPDETALLSYSINYDESVALKPDLFSPVDESYNYTNIFEITKDGEVMVVNPADREQMKQITLVLKVVDLNAEVNKPQEDTLRIRVTILDENDNDPIFIGNHTPSGYVGKVPENVKDVTLFNVFAFDIDENNTITYTMEGNEKAFKHFHLNPKSGELRVVNKIDYEVDQSINFTAVATDNGVPPRSSSIGVFIEIIDENDNTPQFEDQPYFKSIEEHVPKGTFVLQVNASDIDSGNYGLVYFRISRLDQDDDYFQIQEKTGIITVKEDLDREIQEVFKINVQAYDNPFDPRNQLINNTKVTVTLLDINDNAPVIDVITECLRIAETTPVKTTIVKITATDKDKENTPNSEIEFFVEEQVSEYFEITLNGILFVNNSLKNLHNKFDVTVMAKDKGEPPLNDTQIFCVEVYDVNTHTPVFYKPPAGKTGTAIVDETIGTSHVIFTFEAKDDDNNKKTNGRVSYKLVEEEFQNGIQPFVIDPDDGVLRLNKGVILNKGITPEYEIKVEACDNGEEEIRCAEHAKLYIYIRSETDQKPHFDKTQDEVSFTEHSVPGDEKQSIPKAELKKKYVGPENVSMPICYYIVGGDTDFFNLNKRDGILTLAKVVDREVTPFYSVIIEAETDCSNNPPKLDKMPLTRPHIINITVRILDINDNAPVFAEKNFYGGVNAKDKAGKQILTVYATDADEGENAVITYLIVDEVKVNKGEGLDKVSVYFNINETSGAITLAFQPSVDTKGHFVFTVMAKDIGDLNDTAEVSIYIVRSDQQVRLIIAKNVNEITEEYLLNLRKVLMTITKCIVNIDDFYAYSGSKKHYKGFTEIIIHFVEPSTNEVIEADKTISMIDANYDTIHESITDLLDSQQITDVQEEKSVWEEHGDRILYSVIGIISFFLIIVLIVYYIRIKSYKRLLKAATAKAYSPYDYAVQDLSKTAVPNTNLHAVQGSNPIWNQEDEIVKNICEEDSLSNNGSTNSLDVNVIEPITAEENCRENPLFNDEGETNLENKRDSTELASKSSAIFEGTNYTHQQPTNLGNRLDILREVDGDWRRRLTNGSITPIKTEQNFSFGNAKLAENEVRKY